MTLPKESVEKQRGLSYDYTDVGSKKSNTKIGFEYEIDKNIITPEKSKNFGEYITNFQKILNDKYSFITYADSPENQISEIKINL